jgi:hypothetical protein
VDPNAGRPDRTFQWNLSLQRELSRDLVVEVSYVGNRNVWQPTTTMQDFNAVSVQGLAKSGFTVGNVADADLLNRRLDQLSTTDRSTLTARGVNLPYGNFPLNQTVFQSLRNFPQYTNVPNLTTSIAPSSPLGKSWYDSFQIAVNKRYSNGLQLNANYTYSKNLQHVSAFDVFNRANGKDIVGGNPPQILRVSFLYETPRPSEGTPILGNRWVARAVAGWGLSAALFYQTAGYMGRPLNGSGNAVSRWLGRGPGGAQLRQNTDGSYMSPWATNWTDLDGKVHAEPLDINCHCFDPEKTLVLNPAAWSAVPDGQWAAQTQILPDYRASRRPSEAMNLARNFRFGADSRYTIQIRAEFQNIFNRRFLPTPQGPNLNFAAAPVLTADGRYNSGFGTFGNLRNANQFGTPRSGQFIARFSF